MNYPNGIKRTKLISTSNRGMSLEDDINLTNEYYLINDLAIIHKKPVPITIKKVNFKSRSDALITEARFKIPSTTDYNGLYKGFYIDFEAKETRLLNLPLANIHEHQIKHLIKIHEHKGISFLIVRFTLLDKTFLLETKHLISFLGANSRKSIPFDFFEKFGFLLKVGYNPRLDYLSVLEKIRSEY